MFHRLIPILLLLFSGLLSAQSSRDSLNYYGLHLTAGGFQSFGVSGELVPWIAEDDQRIYATPGFELGIEQRFHLGLSSTFGLGVGFRYQTLRRTERQIQCGIVPPCWEENVIYEYRQPEATVTLGIRRYGSGRWHYGGAIGLGYRLTNRSLYGYRNSGGFPAGGIEIIVDSNPPPVNAPFSLTPSRLSARFDAIVGYRLTDRWRLELAVQQQFNRVGIYTICGPNENCAQPNGTPLIEARPLSAVLRAQFAL